MGLWNPLPAHHGSAKTRAGDLIWSFVCWLVGHDRVLEIPEDDDALVVVCYRCGAELERDE